MGKICPNPECGFTGVEEDDVFCPECRTRLVPEESVAPNFSHPSVGTAAGGALIGEGARVNVTGGISQTTHTKQDFNVAKIDVHQKEKKEFCEICGNPFGEKHARCPECGKEICFDCKVKGKNRCVKCEKRAIEEYQASFQQALLESKGKIDPFLRRMMDREADKLNVEDVKEGIERKSLELYRLATKVEQPEVVPIATVAAVSAVAKPQDGVTTRGIGSLSGERPITPKSDQEKKKKNGGGAKWTFILFLIVVAGALYFFMGGDDDLGQSSESVQQVEQSADSQPVSKPAVKTTPQPVQQVQKAPATEKQVAEPVQPAVKKDTNYEAGMKAYDAGNGIEAINAFKKSGSAKAYYMLGVIYENGCGNVAKNPMLARKNYKKAADMGNAEAKAKL